MNPLKAIKMKIAHYVIFILSLLAAGCSTKDDNKLSNHDPDLSNNQPGKMVNVSRDTLMGGDTFVTTGPAGTMQQKQGKIVMIADSGLALPIKLDDDNNIMAIGLTDSTVYQVKKEGSQTALILPDSNKVLKNGRMMLLTDDGEMLEVKLLGDHMVVLTKNNTMLPLEKK